MSIHDAIYGDQGYHLDALTDAELRFVRRAISEQYLDRLAVLQPELVPSARDRGIDQYHTLPVSFDHARAWPKATRLLDQKYEADFWHMGFMRRIRHQFGAGTVLSHGELNWRLVRPGHPGDVGPLHADKWFWDAGYGYGSMPPGYDRFKIWIAIYTIPGANGLRVKPGSHRYGWDHHFEDKDGVRKPVFDGPEPDGLELLPLAAGQMVMFHDELLHGGVVNQGESCRVSLELTILFDPVAVPAGRQPEAREMATAG